MTHTKPRFEARCRLKRPVRLVELADDVLALVDAGVTTPGRIKSRYDKKLGNVVDLPCEFSTEDPAAFEQHMAEVHGRKSTCRGVWSTPSSELPFRASPMWKTPKAKKVDPDPKDWAGRADELGQDVTLELEVGAA